MNVAEMMIGQSVDSRHRDSADRIDEAAEPGRNGDLARGIAARRSCRRSRRWQTVTAAEPEVVKKGKKEEGGEAAARATATPRQEEVIAGFRGSRCPICLTSFRAARRRMPADRPSRVSVLSAWGIRVSVCEHAA